MQKAKLIQGYQTDAQLVKAKLIIPKTLPLACCSRMTPE